MLRGITPAEFTSRVDSVLGDVRDHIIAKNVAYGDSALNPIRVFSKQNATEGLRVRIDDKLARIMRGDVDAFGESPTFDILGYLILLEVAERLEAGM